MAAFAGSDSAEIILLGTGASSSVPHVECLTALPGESPCKTCLSALTPQGKKNKRRNTSCAIRMTAKHGQKITIIIDVGKNFQAAALEWFPKYGLRSIDALLISHAHADAIHGLDDLRSWTLNNNIQSHIDVYLSQDTFAIVKRAFPYLISREFASGSGKVADFKWHVIKDVVPFEIQDTGIWVQPFAVHHGLMRPVTTPTVCVTTPPTTEPSTPSQRQRPDTSSEDNSQPYLCFAFKVGDKVMYISDVSHIPEDKWPVIQSSPSPVLVLDCLRLLPTISHIGIACAVEIARRVGASRTYLTGLGHEVMYSEYVTIGEVVGGGENDMEQLTETEKKGLGLIEEGKNLWLRPAYDGLRVFVEADGQVWDETVLDSA